MLVPSCSVLYLCFASFAVVIVRVLFLLHLAACFLSPLPSHHLRAFDGSSASASSFLSCFFILSSSYSFLLPILSSTCVLARLCSASCVDLLSQMGGKNSDLYCRPETVEFFFFQH